MYIPTNIPNTAATNNPNTLNMVLGAVNDGNTTHSNTANTPISLRICFQAECFNTFFSDSFLTVFYFIF